MSNCSGTLYLVYRALFSLFSYISSVVRSDAKNYQPNIMTVILVFFVLTLECVLLRPHYSTSQIFSDFKTPVHPPNEYLNRKKVLISFHDTIIL